ncbi:MAG: hypothetical protein JNM17_39015 [Archangium sp.]|nr:hypothetical protein [Archangium sp.]
MDDEIHLELEGFSVVSKLAKVWDLLSRDGHRFDTYSVGNTDRPLGEDPLGRVAVWLKKKSFWQVVFRSADPNGPTFILGRDRLSMWFDWRGRRVDAWLDWLDALLALAPVESGKVWRRDFETFNVFQHGPHSGWLFICGGAVRARLERAGIPAFLAKHKGGFQRTSKKTLVTGLAASPLDAVPGKREALTEAVDVLLIDDVERQAKVDVLRVGREVFRRVLGPHGFKERKDSTRRELHFSKGKLSVVSTLDPGERSADLIVSARLAGSSPNSYWPWPLGRGPLTKAKVTLEKALTRFVADQERFVKNPRRFRSGG